MGALFSIRADARVHSVLCIGHLRIRSLIRVRIGVPLMFVLIYPNEHAEMRHCARAAARGVLLEL